MSDATADIHALFAAYGYLAFRVEERRRLKGLGRWGWLGDLAIRLSAMEFAWDRLLERLRRAAKPQIVHVHFKEGGDLYGVLAAGGRAEQSWT